MYWDFNKHYMQKYCNLHRGKLILNGMIFWIYTYISDQLSAIFLDFLNGSTRLSHRPNKNICKPHIEGKTVPDIKWCVVIFSLQSYSRSQTALYDGRSAFCWGQWARLVLVDFIPQPQVICIFLNWAIKYLCVLHNSLLCNDSIAPSREI